MEVRFIRLMGTRRRHRRPGKSPTTDPAFVHAEVDGHGVICKAGRGWECSCPDPDCAHIDAVADLIHPNMLAELDK